MNPSNASSAGRVPAALLAASICFAAQAVPPDIEYMFPAGARRGTTVPVRIGGYYFHGQANFEMLSAGVRFQPIVKRTKTIWFEGPLIYQPLSQQSETYPKDHLNKITVAKNAAVGYRLWRCWTSQGATKTLKFIIGDLPEVMENEMDGRPIPRVVTLPVTANGRIFPREDIDIWAFDAKAGETIICDAAAKRFGSPLNIVLAIRDAKGNPIASDQTSRGGDPIHWFTAPRDGRYAIHIHDAKFWGLQNHIYRLTIKRGPHILHHYPLGAQRGAVVQAEFSGPGLPAKKSEISFRAAKGDRQLVSVKNWGTANFAIGDYPEQLESAKSTASAPVVFNGRIAKPGETDTWKIKLEGKQKIIFDLAAVQLGSPLDAVLSIHDAEGKQLATNDDRAKGQPDPRLDFTAKAGGVYTIKISERFASRGGPTFAYRLTAAAPLVEKPDFSLSFGAMHLNLTRLTEPLKDDAKPSGPKLKINVQRRGGFKGEIQLALAGLPKNVKVFNTKIAANKNNTNLQFVAPPKTKLAIHRLTVKGIGDLGDKNATRAVTTTGDLDHLLFAIVPPVPFKHNGIYRIITGLPGGTTFHRKYSLDRGGFDGPLTVRLADKQIRHLQGVTDRIINVPKGADKFSFPVTFPARVEVGRTSRVVVMLVGEMTDFDGTKHKISYTSQERNDQLISVAGAGLVSVETVADSFTVPPNGEFTISVAVRREPAVLKQPMQVELLPPSHTEDIFAEPVELLPGETKVALKIRTADSPGPFNAPFKIRAKTTAGPRHIAEKEIDFVAPTK
jgi:hypothetical protein